MISGDEKRQIWNIFFLAGMSKICKYGKGNSEKTNRYFSHVFSSRMIFYLKIFAILGHNLVFGKKAVWDFLQLVEK